MKKDPSSEDTLLKLLVSWLSKNAEAAKSQADKNSEKPEQKSSKSMSLEEAVLILSETLTKCVQEVTKITSTLTATVKAVNEHSAMIEDLYTVQNGLLQLLKSSTSTTIIDSKQPDVAKKKTEKPN